MNYTATTEIYTLSLHDALPISQDQLADFVKQGGGLVPQFPLQFFLALEIRQLGEFPARKLQELVHAVIDVRAVRRGRSEEHTSELQSLTNLVCRLLLEKKKQHL